MARWVLFVGVVGFAIPAAIAEVKKETLPFFGHIANVKENSALSMDCDGDPLGSIDCHFTQVTVSVSEMPEVEKARAEMTRAPTATASERKETRLKVCSPSKAPEQPPQRAALRERSLGRFAKACSCRDDQCFDREFIDALLAFAQEPKCKVWTHTFKATLNRVRGQRKWVGTAESGVCRDVNATVVESDEKGHLWKFTQTRLTTDTTNELCKGRVVNEPVIYSWDVEDDALLNCEVVAFGH